MRLLHGHDATVAEFVAKLSPIEQPVWVEPYWALGIIRDDGALVGGAVFSELHAPAGRVQLSGAALSAHVFGPQIVAEIGDFGFGQLKAFRIWARTSVDNRRARKFLKHCGFIEEATQAHWYGEGRHAITSRTIKPDWIRKWRAPEVTQKAA